MSKSQNIFPIPFRRKDRERLLEEYPGLEKDTGYWAILRALISGKDSEKNEGYKVVPHEYLAKVLGIKETWRLNSGNLLQGFSDDVIKLDIKDYGIIDGEAREIKCLEGIPDSIIDMFTGIITDEERVVLHSGVAYNSRVATKYLKEKADAAKVQVKVAKARSQALQATSLILEHYSEINRTRYSKIIGPNLKDAWKVLDEHVKDFAPIDRANLHNRMNEVEALLVPFYESGRVSDRVREVGGAPILNLPTKVRETLFRGQHQVDLVSAQLSINIQLYIRHFAHILTEENLEGLKEIEAWLKGRGNFWAEFDEEAKPYLKKGIYGLFFGASIATLKESLGDYYEEFRAHPLITTIRKSVQQIHSTIISGQTVVKHPVTDEALSRIEYINGKRESNFRQALAVLSQAYEQILIGGVYKAYEERPDLFTPLLHLHDGVIFSVKRAERAETTYKLIEGYITAEAEALGMFIYAEFEVL